MPNILIIENIESVLVYTIMIIKISVSIVGPFGPGMHCIINVISLIIDHDLFADIGCILLCRYVWR